MVDRRAERWVDRAEQRWDAIARAVAAVGGHLAAGDWTTDDHAPEIGVVELSDTTLSATELHIVRSWFSDAEAVRVDPWWEPIENGRHRLWSTLPLFGELLVPIQGGELHYANPETAAVIGSLWSQAAGQNLVELDTISWFDADDPLNRTFRSALVKAASGVFPSPA